MNGPEHYEEAERILHAVSGDPLTHDEQVRWTADAQVHALLALTSALVEIGMSRSHARDSGWAKIITPRTADDTSIEELNLGVRAYNVLRREGIHTVGQLTKYRVSDLMPFRNLNATNIEEIIYELRERGRDLAEEPDRYRIRDEASIEELGLSVHALSVLRRKKIQTVGQLTALTLDDLKNMRNLGNTGVGTIQSCLHVAGRELAEAPTTD